MKLYSSCRPKSASISASWRKKGSSVLIRHTHIYNGKQESHYVIYILSLDSAFDSVLEIRLVKSQDYTDNEIDSFRTHTPGSCVRIRASPIRVLYLNITHCPSLLPVAPGFLSPSFINFKEFTPMKGSKCHLPGI